MIKKQVANAIRVLMSIGLTLVTFCGINYFLYTSNNKIEIKKEECYNHCNSNFQIIEGMEEKGMVYSYEQMDDVELIALENLEKKRLAALEATLAEQRQLETVDYEATFYTAECVGCTGVTANGYNVKNTIYFKGYRIVAASPEHKFNTILRITLVDGTSFEAIVLDRGGGIKGKRLDILVNSKEEAYKLGRQTVKVAVIN